VTSLTIINDELNSIEVGLSQAFKNITMFPLLRQNAIESNYLTLDEALEVGTARVTEVSEGGDVPELHFLNEGEVPVLLLDGEELVGAKQNRVLNLSILAPANASISIPVSCVEAGRWSYRSRTFSSSPRTMYAKGRAAKSRHVSMSMRESGTRRSDQSAIWDDISAKSERMSVTSDTGAMSDIYDRKEKGVKKFVEHFRSIEGQIGAVFAIDNTISGVDLFDSSDTLEKALPKLVRSYALDAVETASPVDDRTDREDANRFLEILADSNFASFPAVGLGEDLRIESTTISGGALVSEGQTIHLWAFPLKSEQTSERGRVRSQIARSSRRKRSR
jgi:hypothetical protein